MCYWYNYNILRHVWGMGVLGILCETQHIPQACTSIDSVQHTVLSGCTTWWRSNQYTGTDVHIEFNHWHTLCKPEVVDRKNFWKTWLYKWPTVVLMPKIWTLQSKIIFSSWIECCPVPSLNMAGSTFKRGSKSWVWVSEVNKFKIIVRCLAWQQIKVVKSLNHLKLFQNHNCLTK